MPHPQPLAWSTPLLQKAVTRLEAAGNSDKLALYALYKQATEGDNTTPKPGMFDIIGRVHSPLQLALLYTPTS